MTIYEKTPGGLVATGERSIQTFASGLVRVDRKYIGAQGNENEHRALLAVDLDLPDDSGYPAIDGLYIFPDTQEAKDGAGFTTYQTSAYGRTTSSGRNTGQTQETISQTSDENTQGEQFLMSFTLKTYYGAIVIPSGNILTLDDITLPNDFYAPYNFRLPRTPYFTEQSVIETQQILGGVLTRIYKITFVHNELTVIKYLFLQDPQIVITAQRDFGRWSEIEYRTSRNVESATDTI